MKRRCEWPKDKLMLTYHDKEWGVPLHDDRKHFEFLILDAFQAGLSWSTILNKRIGFRKAFAGFDPAKVARFDSRTVKKLLSNKSIIRNKLKINAAIANAKEFLKIQKEFGKFDNYIWQFVGGKPIVNRRKSLNQIPSTSPESDAMSKGLKKRGFKFVGSTICYAYMQAAGMVNDHVTDCFRHGEIVRMK